MTPERCPYCDARVINRGATSCWLCLAPFPGSETTPPAPQVETPTEAVREGAPPRTTTEAISAGTPLSSSFVSPQPGQSRAWRPHEEPATDSPVIAVLGLVLLLGVIGLIQGNAGGIALLFFVAATPALARVAYFSIKQNATGKRPLTFGEKALFFFTSLGVVTMIGVASAAAFFATCFVICLGSLSVSSMSRGGHGGYEWILFLSVGGGLIPGILVAVFTIRHLWARKI